MVSAGQMDSWPRHSEAALPEGRGRPRVLAEADRGPGVSSPHLGQASGDWEAKMVVTERLGAMSETGRRRR